MNSMDRVDILDVSQLVFEGDFFNQVNYILNHVRLTREEVVDLRNLYQDVEDALRRRWRSCKVIPFGSIITGLGIKTSDADCYVDVKYKEMSQSLIKNAVTTARNILGRIPRFSRIIAITSAKVPIVQFTHVPSQRQCDVSFTSRAGARNSELISYFLQTDERALPLAILIKYWSKVHSLTGTNRLSNYSLTMLLIFYLQQVNIFPSVEFLQKTTQESDFVCDWNTSFYCPFSSIPQTENETSLPDLLGGFFKYYSEFDFKEYVICPYLGYPVKRNCFASPETVPPELELYLHNVTNRNMPPFRIDKNMCVQDPFEHNRNCTVGVYPKLQATLKAYFCLCAKIYENCSGDYSDYLKQVLTQVPTDIQVLESLPSIVQTNGQQTKSPNKIVKKKRKNKKTLPFNFKRNLHNNVPLWDIKFTAESIKSRFRK